MMTPSNQIKITIDGNLNGVNYVLINDISNLRFNENTKVNMSINKTYITGLHQFKKLFDMNPNLDIVKFTNNTILESKL